MLYKVVYSRDDSNNKKTIEVPAMRPRVESTQARCSILPEVSVDLLGQGEDEERGEGWVVRIGLSGRMDIY